MLRDGDVRLGFLHHRHKCLGRRERGRYRRLARVLGAGASASCGASVARILAHALGGRLRLQRAQIVGVMLQTASAAAS